mgnify:CR=1 FL=1
MLVQAGKAGWQAEVQVQKCRFPLPELQTKVQNPKVQKCRIWAPRSASAEVQIIFPAGHSRSADSRKCKCRIWSAECRNSAFYPPCFGQNAGANVSINMWHLPL